MISSKQKIFFLITFLGFLLGCAVDLYVPSLPAIADYFHASEHFVQFGIGLYLFGYAAGQIFYGVLADKYGHRKVLLSSIIIFMIPSFIGIIAPSVHVLNICRFVEGLGAAGLAVISRALIADNFSGPETAKAFSGMSMSWALGPIIGPFIGAYLQHYFNWQANFYFFGFYALISLLLAFKFIPETKKQSAPINARTATKAIKSMLSDPIFLYFSILVSLNYSILVVFNVIGPFLIQVVLKYSVIAFGHIALLLGFGYFLGGVTSRILLNRFQPLTIALYGEIGSVVMATIMLVLALTIKLNLLIVVIPALLLFLHTGMVFPNVAMALLAKFPEYPGISSAIFGTVFVTGTSLLSIFSTALKTNSLVPLAIAYVLMMTLSTVLFFAGKRRTHNTPSL